MCYSMREEYEWRRRRDEAREPKMETKPEEQSTQRVPKEDTTFWTYLVGRRNREDRELVDRTREKIRERV